MDTVLESANDPGMVDKALKASATVTANSDQMPFNNQVENRILSSRSDRLQTLLFVPRFRKKALESSRKSVQKSETWPQLMMKR